MGRNYFTTKVANHELYAMLDNQIGKLGPVVYLSEKYKQIIIVWMDYLWHPRRKAGGLC